VVEAGNVVVVLHLIDEGFQAGSATTVAAMLRGASSGPGAVTAPRADDLTSRA
jgi:hypothetical protein